jgi:lysophospholipid acyltransferase (LPLAT)-like uncharacterized protein
VRKARFLASIGTILVRILLATLRVRVVDNVGLLGKPQDRTLIWIFWHNRLMLFPHLIERYLNQRKTAALTSASKDGEIVASFLSNFKVRSIRGSSSRRGAGALIEMKNLLAQGWDVGITPDGPRGPRYYLNPGVLKLAQKTGIPVLPANVEYSRCWRLKSWDGFMIPKPFSRVEITMGKLVEIKQTATDEEFEAERLRLEGALAGMMTQV